MGERMDTREGKHNYGVDLLRIVAMLMIIAHHFSLHSGISYDAVSNNGIVMSVMALGGKTGVNIFVLITGYYSTGKIRKGKVANLFGCATFYSLLLTLVAAAVGSVAFGKKILLKACFPLLLGNNYWFVVTYLELYIMIPILNKVVQALDAGIYKKYLLCFTCLLCIIPTVVGRFIQVNDFGYNSLVWFVYLYFLGAYLNKDDAFKKLDHI